MPTDPLNTPPAPRHRSSPPDDRQTHHPGVATRLAALKLLGLVLDHHQHLEDVFDRAVSNLPTRDRAFVRRLVATTLRTLGHLDSLVSRHLITPLPSKAADTHHLLRLGAAQILALDTPPHAAVAATVSAARAHPKARHYTGLVNAVLRKVAQSPPGLLANCMETDPLAAWPRWLTETWRAAYGPALARAIADASAREAPLDLTPRATAHDLLLDLLDDFRAKRLDASPLPTGSVRLPPGTSVTDLPGYTEGDWWVQDAAAITPVGLAHKVLQSLEGLQVADLCAAPGGKTLQLAAAGARVWAVDRSPKRLERLSDNLRRTGLGATVTPVVADATQPLPSTIPDGFDMILVDAPCTSTGTLRRHPDVAWLKRPSDAQSLAGVQDAILDTAIRHTRPGGLIVYCVCSLQPEEGSPRIAAALARHPGLSRAPIPTALPWITPPLLTPNGDLRILPCHPPLAEQGGWDGFFVALLRVPEHPHQPTEPAS